jgi:D-xylose transport system ATP-binding protein
MHLLAHGATRLSGSVRLNGRELRVRKPEEIIREGMVLVSEDRRRYGLILDKDDRLQSFAVVLAKLTKKRLIDQGLEFQKNNTSFNRCA